MQRNGKGGAGKRTEKPTNRTDGKVSQVEALGKENGRGASEERRHHQTLLRRGKNKKAERSGWEGEERTTLALTGDFPGLRRVAAYRIQEDELRRQT